MKKKIISLMIAVLAAGALSLIHISSSLHNVAGVVLDAHGQPIIGASVVIKGTTIGISTNVDGSFGLQIPASVKDPVLVVNYLGCEPQEIRCV